MTARRNRMKTHAREETVRILAALAAIGLLLPASRASAARIDITPAISLDQVYDSNVFNTDGDEKGDFLFRATPAVTFSLRMPETTLNLRASMTSDTYYKYTELSDTPSAVRLALDAAPPLRISPRFSISPSAYFVQARDSYLRTQQVPSADPLAPPSVASETARRESRNYGAALRANYLLTENAEFSLGGGFSKLQYLDNTAGDIDSRVISGDTSITHRFTPLFSSGVFFNTSYNTFENGTESRVYAGGLTGAYRFSPTFTVNARAGATHAKETFTTGAPEFTKTSPYGALSLVYSDNNFRASLSGTIEQAGGGNLGQTTRRETVSLSISDQFATHWWADLAGSYQVNRSLESDASGKLTSATGSAGVRYQPLRWLGIHLSGSGFRQSGDGTLGSDLTRYSATLGATVSNTYNIY